MTRLAQLLHLDDGEFPELRAKIEAKPIRMGRHAPLAPLPLGAPARAVAGLAELRAADRALGMRRPSAPVAPRPIVLTDWSARLADDWTHVESNLDDLRASIVREASRTAARNQYSVHVLAAPLLSELTELTAVQLPEWRQALRVHAEDELALYDAESEAGR